MANSIALVTKFLAILDEVYKKNSLTAALDSPTKPVEFGGAAAVNVLKLSAIGLGTYSRSTGYPGGNVTAEWETLTLAASRGRGLAVDRMDNEETLGMAFGRLADEWMRTKVAPEVDAYRFSKFASWSGISSPSQAALADAAAVVAALRVATNTMDEDEVPEEGRILYITPTLLGYVADQDTTKSKEVLARFSQIVRVPQSRFYKGVTLDPGAAADEGGYSKTASTGRDLNFMVVHPTAVLQAVKHDNMKYFDPDTNQTADQHLLQYRLYHDAFVYENHVDGVYAHVKNS